MVPDAVGFDGGALKMSYFTRRMTGSFLVISGAQMEAENGVIFYIFFYSLQK
jgi:hypothetical protein